MENNNVMSQEDFMLIMDLIDGAYQNFRLTENTVKTYYYFLQHYENKKVWEVADEWIAKSEYPPTVKDLLSMLERK